MKKLEKHDMKRSKRTTRLGIATLLLASWATTASEQAWDGTVRGKVARLEMVPNPEGDNPNYSARVVLEGRPELCGNENTWAYINTSDGNYKGIIATLLSVKLTESEVLLYTNRDERGFCRLGYLILD